MSSQKYTPRPEHKFTFGLWTVGNRGRDPFGDAVRPTLPPVEAVRLLAEVGAWGVNFHDNDLVPIDATPAERDRIVREFRSVCAETGLVVPMATVNLFYDAVFRDGAFTANDARVRAYAVQKTCRAMDLGAECGAQIFVLWGGREGVETDGCRRPDEAIKRLREAINYLCEYSLDQNYGYKFALEAKPNEPRADIYMPTTGAYLAFITTLDHPEMVGVNPEVAHEHMPDLRFGSANPKAAFWLVKFLEDVGYAGARHFDAHAYRTEDYEGVKDFARGCMRTYLVLREKARQWNVHPEIRALLAEIAKTDGNGNAIGKYDQARAAALLAQDVDRAALAAKGLQYERLDQLTMDILLGVA